MTPSPESRSRVPLATIRFEMFGQESRFDVPVPSGPSRLADLLPAAATMAGEAAALTVGHARSEGREVSCRAGCGACCRQIVAISLVEAKALADHVASLPEERRQLLRQRFTEAIRRLEEAGLLDRGDPPGRRTLVARNLGSLEAARADLTERYFRLGIACPFLEDESCSIHPIRPMVCRGYHVTSPAERCARLYDEPVDSIFPPFNVGDVLAVVVEEYTGVSRQSIPLVLSLEWSEEFAELLSATHDGRAMFGSFLKELARRAEKAG